ncbi:response regulator [Leifsonia sp. Root112D2]|jgi:LmbE family N-acetylglucosaminyl deacetylase/CheY-like chemotaxis protein|uniref:response regulator n=1 Tax=Leifsonia sp. Root112D2 TaxID=1736426 RepID=UPI0006FF5BE0|nr:response regulator [Leifsonia sp. Root112D2]KQV07913.1 histidine kinase [Leifsonia sp. Root112D2]
MSDPYRVLVIEDDLDVALYTKTVLEKRAGCEVLSISDPSLVRAAVERLRPDVVITDIEMPGASGLDLISEIRAQQPGTPVIVMTAHVSVDYAVSALRNQADEFLTKPIASADLVSNVTRLAEASRESREREGAAQVVLAIGAHPNDVEIGVGGILAAHRSAGDEVIILTLSKGDRAGGVRVAWNEGSASAETIGARLVLEDNGETALSGSEPTAGVIRRAVEEFKPAIVYVHSKHDRSPDHRAVHEAALEATGKVRTVACYQSSTATVEFRPTRFVTIDGFIDTKVAMLGHYAIDETERPRYLEAEFTRAVSRYWSRFGTGTHCEPLELLRDSADV